MIFRGNKVNVSVKSIKTCLSMFNFHPPPPLIIKVIYPLTRECRAVPEVTYWTREGFLSSMDHHVEI